MPAESFTEIAWIGLSLMMLGMSKGGFPIGSIALPMLILAWPDPARSAREAISFMLPMLCCMDIVAVANYRKTIRRDLIKPLLPATLLGVAVGTSLFVYESSMVAVSETALKALIGTIGLCFVLYRVSKRRVIARMDRAAQEHPRITHSFGFVAGFTSTMAHAAGPIMQMHMLPKRLPKLEFAGTLAGYFFLLNLVKLVPFIALGRISLDHLKLGAMLLPLIPVGVLLGAAIVRRFNEAHYTKLIYGTLTAASLALLAKSAGLL
jgi:uncharacterized membrane protein YfcA